MEHYYVLPSQSLGPKEKLTANEKTLKKKN